VAYFHNPGFPNSTQTDCSVQVNLQPSICQLRLDFLDFKLPGMQSGICDSNNVLSLSSSVPYAFIPTSTLCGTLSNSQVDLTSTDLPHLYLHLEDVTKTHPGLRRPNPPPPSVTLSARVKDQSRWNIRLTQIPCGGSELLAPPGCAHYHLQSQGVMTSLNFAGGSYARNTSLTTCLKPDLEACAVQYDFDYLGVDGYRGGKLNYGLSCGDFVSRDCAGQSRAGRWSCSTRGCRG
jgi:hypothetical protein